MKKKKMKIGELVCLFRRKRPGVGIVLEIARVPPEKIKLIEKAKTVGWKEKGELKEEALKDTGRPELVEASFLYNLWQSNAKIKKDFAYIRWLHHPSEYNQRRIKTAADWFPLEWVRKIE